MLFSIGTKVRLKHTGDKGEVTDILDNGMLNVWIDSEEMEIPVSEENVIREQDYANQPTKAKTKIIATLPPVKKIVKFENTASKNASIALGIQLAFDPDYDSEGAVKKYQAFLINDTPYDFLFSLKINTAHKTDKTIHDKITATSTYYIKDILFDQLNDALTFEGECWKVTTEGTGKKQHKIIKIKPKQFFKKVKNAPLLNRPVHLYLLFEKAEAVVKKEENLKDYTQKNTRPVNYKQSKSNFKKYNLHDVKEYANFSGEIDLHIENLSGYIGKMNNGEKLRLQIRHFEEFMDKAIRLGVPRVYIIHGIGKGKLRDIVSGKLIQMRAVKTFKNEYHPRYGWGATEVIF